MPLKNRTPKKIRRITDFFRKGEKVILKFSGHILIKNKWINERIEQIITKREVATQMSEKVVDNLSITGFRILLIGKRSQKKRAKPKKRLGFLGLVNRSDRKKSWINQEERKTIGMIWGMKCLVTL